MLALLNFKVQGLTFKVLLLDSASQMDSSGVMERESHKLQGLIMLNLETSH